MRTFNKIETKTIVVETPLDKDTVWEYVRQELIDPETVSVNKQVPFGDRDRARTAFLMLALSPEGANCFLDFLGLKLVPVND